MQLYAQAPSASSSHRQWRVPRQKVAAQLRIRRCDAAARPMPMPRGFRWHRFDLMRPSPRLQRWSSALRLAPPMALGQREPPVPASSLDLHLAQRWAYAHRSHRKTANHFRLQGRTWCNESQVYSNAQSALGLALLCDMIILRARRNHAPINFGQATEYE